jgi:RHS repeat-associated protein
MTPGSGGTQNYSFDASSNLTGLPAGGTGTYDKAGELTSATQSGNTTSYTYNADGERLTSTQGSSTVSSGSWNGAGQLSSYTSSAGTMTAARYNGDGQRATATATTTTTGTGTGTQQFVWDTVTAVPQALMDSQNAYIYCGGLAPAEQVNLTTGTVTYLVADSLGSVRGTVSASGSLTGTTSYDAWGNSETTGGLTATTPFGYAGGYTDPTGLIYLVNRYYDPQTGQFTSVDPAIAQTVQPYAYANGNPVSYTDPSGACNWWCEGFSWSAAGIVGGLCGALTAEDGLGWICWGLGNGVFDAVSYWWDARHPGFWNIVYHFVRGFAIGAIFSGGGRSSSAIGRQDIRSDRLGVGGEPASASSLRYWPFSRWQACFSGTLVLD